MWMFFLFLGLTYLLGSIPTGYLLTKSKKGNDIRKIGSGATGGTNVSRALGLKWGIVVGVFDIIKVALPVYFANNLLSSDWQILSVALTGIIGHIFPVWLNFKAGKGVSTFLGTLFIFLGWRVVLLIIVCFITIILIVRMVSVGSLIISLTVPLVFWIFNFSLPYIIFGIIAAAIIWWAHRENIFRIIKGKESKISF